jgi:asparaginyl-tRNA synthetase
MKTNSLTINPPQSWRNLGNHYKTVLSSDWYKILSKLQDEFTFATVQFYRERGMKFMQLPITTGSISSPMGLGSDSSPVKVNISGIDTYLADSMQFFLEYASRINKEGSYYIAPSFRGELADERHLCQFYHSEAEIIGNLEDVITLCQDYLHHLVKHALSTCKEEIISITGTTEHLDKFLEISSDIPRCPFDEAVSILHNDSNYVINHDKYRTINSDGEKKLMKHFGGYVWLTHFDHLSVPFYQRFEGEDKAKALNADLLMGIGETIGSGERHLSGEEVVAALDLHEVDHDAYEWYIELKNLVPVQTSGFGLGVERFFLWMLNHDDIRDMQIVPRFNGVRTPF